MLGADEEEAFQAMEALVYNLNSMHSRRSASAIQFNQPWHRHQS